jgi:transposase
VLTERARAAAARRVGRDADSVAEVARAYGTGWHTVMRAVREHGQPRVDNPARTALVAALGMERPGWDRHGAGP